MNLIDDGKISGKQAKEVFAEMFASGKSAAAIVKEKGIEQLSDAGAIEALCDQVIADNPKPVGGFQSGQPGLAEFSEGAGDEAFAREGEPRAGGRDLGAKINRADRGSH